MRLLADTHVVFWATMERARLSQAARAALESEENDVLVSVASAWEIAIKVGIGKWPEARDLLFDFERHMADAGFEVLPITVAHVRTAGMIAAPHRDPFDRLLAAQATIDGLVLVTADASLATLGAACAPSGRRGFRRGGRSAPTRGGLRLSGMSRASHGASSPGLRTKVKRELYRSEGVG